MNVVKTTVSVEIQGTGEESTFSKEELSALLSQADAGPEALFEAQVAILDGIEQIFQLTSFGRLEMPGFATLTG